MFFWLHIITIITKIYPCILRKRQHCIEKRVLKDRVFPDYVLDLSNDTNNSMQNMYKKRIELFPEENIDKDTNSHKSKHAKIDFTVRDLGSEPKNPALIKESVENKKLSNNLSQTQIVTGDLKKDELSKNIFSRDIEDLLNNIQKYMTLFMSKIQLRHYLSRLDNINQIYENLFENELQHKNFHSIFKSCDLRLFEILNCVIYEFDSNTKFLQKNYSDFISKLFRKIYSEKKIYRTLIKLRSNNMYDKKFLFCYEFIYCTKYFSEIPELLTLGGVYSNTITFDLIFSIHLIKLLLQRKNIEEIKIFVVFLIRRAFLNSVKKKIDVFSVSTLNTDCWVDLNTLHQYNIHFFLWEMISHRRQEVQVKLKGQNVLICSRIDKLHFKSILLIFVYQQMIFLKYNNFSEEKLKRHELLINNIIEEGTCPICEFKEFLGLLKVSD